MAPCVQLVEEDGKNGLKVCDDGVALLRQATNEGFYIICIAGVYRSGKSLILNRLAKSLGHEPAFRVGSTTESCTRGIWMSIHGDYILLDTEGLASVDQDENYDTKIFTLGLLLSSYFVYNSMGIIDEPAIDKLHMVGKLAKGVLKSNRAGFPFLWLLRDFSLNLEEYENNPSLYLEDALKDKERKSSNVARQEIRQIFRSRQCRTLVRPLLDEKFLQKLDSLNESDMRPEFVEQMHEVFSLIREQTQKKTLNAQTLTGPMLADFLGHCLKHINSGSFPDIKKTFQYVADESFRAISVAAEQQYLDDMGACTKGSDTWADIVRVHERARENALALFHEAGTLNAQSKPGYIEQTSKTISKLFLDTLWPKFVSNSVAASESFVSELVDSSASLGPQDFASFLASIKIDDDTISGLGPERFRIILRGVVRDLIHARVCPTIEKMDADLSHRLEKVTELKRSVEHEQTIQEEIRAKLYTCEEALKVEQINLVKMESLATQSQASLQTLEQALKEERDNHAQTRSRLDSKVDALQRETQMVVTIQSELANLKKLEQLAREDADMVRKEYHELLEDAAKQQDDFDKQIQMAKDLSVENEVLLSLKDVIHNVEMSAAMLDLSRIKEERQQLHQQLQEFMFKASQLPDFFQSVLYDL